MPFEKRHFDQLSIDNGRCKIKLKEVIIGRIEKRKHRAIFWKFPLNEQRHLNGVTWRLSAISLGDCSQVKYFQLVGEELQEPSEFLGGANGQFGAAIETK